MKRIFNIAGPCHPRDHYMIDAMRRLGKEVYAFIEEKQYFLIHAARQSGKTTLLKELTRRINAEGAYYALYCSLENGESIADATQGIPAVMDSLRGAIVNAGLPGVSAFEEGAGGYGVFNRLQQALVAYCRALDKPLVLFFDESDCLCGQTLVSFLRQIRNGYGNRAETPFVHSLALVGMRNIRDHRDEYRVPEQTLGSASPFNIVAAHMELRNFTKSEIAELYGQHTTDMGQDFEADAIDFIWEKTQGQPWLVNAVAREMIQRHPGEALTALMAADAVGALLLRRDTHFDSLIARLHEPRVRRILEPILIGETGFISHGSDDYDYVKDVGLIRDDRGKTEPANPMYGDIIVRTLNADTQREIGGSGADYQMPRYLNAGTIDMDFLLRDFQVFWRENADIWREKYDYKEAAPQLILQAFLQRILNGGGTIHREMAAATGRTDLCIVYLGRKYPVELKIRRSERTYEEGLRQTAAYMDVLGCDKGWLVVFDTRKTLTWDERLFTQSRSVDGKQISIFGC